MSDIFNIHLCSNSSCNFRFPSQVIIGSTNAERSQPPNDQCPRCGALTRIVESFVQDTQGFLQPQRSELRHIEALLDNIRSVYNVGSMFRTADGCGIAHLHLCGISATPEGSKLSKTALGAEHSVSWSYHNNAVIAADELRNRGLTLWALEGCSGAQSLFDAQKDIPDEPIALVVGNEVSGVDPGLINECERLVYIPMFGDKSSLNAATAFGIAAYYLRFMTETNAP
jgi:23S rRNA (guanosine2251-2'-O)-methyltransferase